jgi:hypothetical protein
MGSSALKLDFKLPLCGPHYSRLRKLCGPPQCKTNVTKVKIEPRFCQPGPLSLIDLRLEQSVGRNLARFNAAVRGGARTGHHRATVTHLAAPTAGYVISPAVSHNYVSTQKSTMPQLVLTFVRQLRKYATSKSNSSAYLPTP